jgi:DNA-binding transcriptional MerR regulator
MHKTKYYSISEVSDLFGISQAALRYLEKIIPKFTIRKIRGRRYYSQENIAILRGKIARETSITPKQYSLFVNDNSYILQKITNLERKFLSLKNRLS